MPDHEAHRIFAQNLTRLLAGRGETQRELASALGVSPSAVSNWCSGAKVPRMGRLDELARHLGVRSAQLLERAAEPAGEAVPPGFASLPETELVPRVGLIACGGPITAEANIEAYDAVPSQWRADFTLLCRGDSMSPRIQDGDLVAIRRQPEVENGEIAAVRIGDEATLKRVYLYPGCLELRPENPAYDPLLKFGEEMNEVSIEGKAVGLRRTL